MGRGKSDRRVIAKLLGQVFFGLELKQQHKLKPAKLFMRRCQGETYILAMAEPPLCLILLL